MKRIEALQLFKSQYGLEKEDFVRWVLAGKVYYNSVRLQKAGEKIPADSILHIKDFNRKYVSRGGLKLEKAIEAFGINVSGKTAADLGASTGGFTDCLIQNNAELVYAVDTGYGQLAGYLRQNSKVVNLEKVNISDERLLSLDPKPEIVTMDLSYLSLQKAIPTAIAILKNQGTIMALIKPLFETTDRRTRRTGKIRSARFYKEVLKNMHTAVMRLPVTCRGIIPSPVRGSGGTREFLICLDCI